MSAKQNNGTGTRPYRVVVGIDFESTGYNALREAVRLSADRGDVELHVVHALADRPSLRPAPAGGAADADPLAPTRARMRSYLTDMLATMPGSGPRPITAHVRVGAPAAVIHQLAADLDADLIVVGTRGLTGLRRFAQGSVADTLVHRALCPVLVAHPKDYAGAPGVETIEPLCPDCAAARRESNGARQWCEFHSRPYVRPHVYSFHDVFTVGGHDPGIVAGGVDR